MRNDFVCLFVFVFCGGGREWDWIGLGGAAFVAVVSFTCFFAGTLFFNLFPKPHTFRIWFDLILLSYHQLAERAGRVHRDFSSQGPRLLVDL